MLEKGGSYIRRAQLNLEVVVTVIWVFQYKAFGVVNKRTDPLPWLYQCSSRRITRMNIATYLSICMRPDLSGRLLVSMTLVV